MIRPPPRSPLFPYTTLFRSLGVEPDTGARAVTTLARHFIKGDLRFHATRPDVEGGVALGNRLASKLSVVTGEDRKSTRLNSSHLVISYAVFCLKKKKKKKRSASAQYDEKHSDCSSAAGQPLRTTALTTYGIRRIRQDETTLLVPSVITTLSRS